MECRIHHHRNGHERSGQQPAYYQINARLEAANETYETRWTPHLIPRKRTGEQRIYSIVFTPEKHDDSLDGQTYSQAREALEQTLMHSLLTPPDIWPYWSCVMPLVHPKVVISRCIA